MLKAQIKLHGRDREELVMALNEVKRLIDEGFTSGKGGTSDGGFIYEREGEEEEPEEDPED